MPIVIALIMWFLFAALFGNWFLILTLVLTLSVPLTYTLWKLRGTIAGLWRGRRPPESEPEEFRPPAFRGILIALPASLLLWWLIWEVVR